MPVSYLGITINHDLNERLTEQARDLLREKYCREGEDIQEAFARACVAYATDPGHAQRLYDYVSQNWFMFSSPILSNAPLPGEKAKGLPIACFGGFVGDDLTNLIEHGSEISWLSVRGGGTSGHWSNVRAVSKKAPGPIPFMQNINAVVNAYKQGVTRRASYAAYLDISHPDIMEFLQIRNPTGGDINRKCLSVGFHHGINVTDKFMHAVENDWHWALIDPHTGDVRDTVRARELWEQIIEMRYRTGEPYLFFIDKANRDMPKAQRMKGLSISGSNLCNEIVLPSDETRTFVCCLSSLNAAAYDNWKDTRIVEDLLEMLDNVITAFIDNTEGIPGFEKARYSAMQERAVGIGVLGLHTLFQKRSIVFGSEESRDLNRDLFQTIRERADACTLILGETRGEAPDMEGTGRRNSCTMAVAPNANSGMIAGASPSIEPWAANAFTSESRIGMYLIRNPEFEQVLWQHLPDEFKIHPDKTGHGWIDAQWKSIIEHKGSVQHLAYLTDHEKAVFRTAKEIDQMDVVTLAADRQAYIDQGQSLNLFFPKLANKEDLSRVHYMAWKLGCKGLYYLRTEAISTADPVGVKKQRQALQDHVETPEPERNIVPGDEPCFACQG